MGQDLARLATRNGQLEMEKSLLEQQLNDEQRARRKETARAVNEREASASAQASASLSVESLSSPSEATGSSGSSSDVYNADRDKVTERLRALETIAQEYKVPCKSVCCSAFLPLRPT